MTEIRPPLKISISNITEGKFNSKYQPPLHSHPAISSVDLLLSVCSFCVVRGGNVGFWVVGIGVVVGAGVVVVVVLVVVVIAKQDKSVFFIFLKHACISLNDIYILVFFFYI